jgi:hypothetical protein
MGSPLGGKSGGLLFYVQGKFAWRLEKKKEM